MRLKTIVDGAFEATCAGTDETGFVYFPRRSQSGPLENNIRRCGKNSGAAKAAPDSTAPADRASQSTKAQEPVGINGQSGKACRRLITGLAIGWRGRLPVTVLPAAIASSALHRWHRPSGIRPHPFEGRDSTYVSPIEKSADATPPLFSCYLSVFKLQRKLFWSLPTS